MSTKEGVLPVEVPRNPDYFSEGGTKPYISSSELWWYTFLGLNHFAVNEPLWGLAKLLTVGGMGLWWAWDLMFMTSNESFVAKNGFPVPFHMLPKRLFGQGAVAPGGGPPLFRQQSTYGLWALSTFLAPLGVQALFEQNYPLFIRNMFNLMVLLYTGYIVISYIFVDGLDSLSFFGWIWLIIIGSVFLTGAPAIFLPWFNTIKVAFDPAALMQNGIPFTSELDAYVNGFKDDVDAVNTKDLAKEINTKWAIGGTNKDYLKKLFTPKTAEEMSAETAETNQKKDSRQTNVWDIAYYAMISPWFKSFLDMGAGTLEFFAARYGVNVDQIKALASGGIGGLTEQLESKGLGALKEKLGSSGLGALEGKLGALKEKLGSSGLGALKEKLGAVENVAKETQAIRPQSGGARDEELSTESLVLGSAVAVIIGAGALKLGVDYLMPT